MNIALWIAIYFICWWLVLFTILPIGMRTQQEEGEVTPGTPRSAPAKPHIIKKMLFTTVIATVIIGIIFVVNKYKLITLDDIPF